MKAIILAAAMFFLVQESRAQPDKTKNVVLISIDGYRWQEIFEGPDSALLFSKKFTRQNHLLLSSKYWDITVQKRREKLMPFFWNTIAVQGQLYGNRNYDNLVNVRNRYRFSYPGRSETLCGYYDPEIKSNHHPDNTNENILEFIDRQEGFTGQVVTFASWDALSRIINRNRNKMLVNIPGERVEAERLSDVQALSNEIQNYLPQNFGEGMRYDVHTYALARSYISANHPRVIYLDFGDTDNYGHAGQYDSYLDAAHYLDSMIGSLWNVMQEDEFYKDNTTFMIYPDHGRGTGKNWTDHGFFALSSGQTWLAAIGPEIDAGGEIKTKMQIYQDQFAQTIANLLGFHFTANHPVADPLPSMVGSGRYPE